MATRIPGIHHVTAIARSPQDNVDFYAGVLGLRLAKKTVNFDDPSTYHLYSGDAVGHPGSILTFFPWPDAGSGRAGTGQVSTTSFHVPGDSLDYLRQRLAEHGVGVEDPIDRFDEGVVEFRDPDGLHLSLVGGADADAIDPWTDGPVPAERAIRGFHGATLTVEAHERTTDLLETMGFEAVGEERGRRFRYRSTAALGATIDVLARPNARRGTRARGPSTTSRSACRAGRRRSSGASTWSRPGST